MYKGKSIAVVVPAYNEENFIAGVIETMPDYVDKIYVVNDCSTDKTAEIVTALISNTHDAMRNEQQASVVPLPASSVSRPAPSVSLPASSVAPSSVSRPASGDSASSVSRPASSAQSSSVSRPASRFQRPAPVLSSSTTPPTAVSVPPSSPVTNAAWLMVSISRRSWPVINR